MMTKCLNELTKHQTLLVRPFPELQTKTNIGHLRKSLQKMNVGTTTITQQDKNRIFIIIFHFFPFFLLLCFPHVKKKREVNKKKFSIRP